MAKQYRHLSLRERERIAFWKARGRSLREIAFKLGRSHSSLSRELKRHRRSGSIPYSPSLAQEKARAKRGGAGRSILKGPMVRAYVREKIRLGWSPEAISGRLPKERPGLKISHEAIYRYIYTNARDLIPFLPRRHKFRYPRHGLKKRRTVIPGRTPLSRRPALIGTRKQFGHWESDAVGSGERREALNVLVERKSRYVRITKLKRNTAWETSGAIIGRLKVYPRKARRTVTYDNGPENVLHQAINRFLGTRSYFCEPYHSWEKGTVENTNGLIRRYIPKGTSLAKWTEAQIQEIEDRLNNRPRKCLGYRTPREVFLSLSGALRS